MNPAPLQPDDPRLTAYALGELEGEDLAAVEAALRLNPALRVTVDDIREAAGHFEAALLTEAQSPLVDAEPVVATPTATILPFPAREPEVAASGGWSRKFVSFPSFYYVVGGMAAACFAIYAAYRSPSPSAKPPVAVALSQAQDEVIRPSVAPILPVSIATESAAPMPAADQALATAPVEPATVETVALTFPTPVAPPPAAAEPPAIVAPTIAATPPTVPAPEVVLPKDPAQVLVAAVFNEPAPSLVPRGLLTAPTSNARAEVINDPDALVPFQSFVTAPKPGDPTGRSLLLTSPILTAPGEEIVVLATMTVSGDRETYYSDGLFRRRRLARSGNLTDRSSLPYAPPGALFARRANLFIHTPDNEFIPAQATSLSSFSAETDTASYGSVRRFLDRGLMPAREAVRIEELVNYFPYDYAAPRDDAPFTAALEVSEAPWAPEHRLVRVGLQGREVANAQRAPLNLVFLIDTSASMAEANRLPLVKESLRMLVGTLRTDDRVAIVTYGSVSGQALPSTPVSRASEILATLDSLSTAGTTNGGLGIGLAYEIAQASAAPGGINRIVLCTDGDFNVGTTDESSLVRLIEEKAQAGVFLTAFGFGMGDEREVTLEKLAEKGHGLFGYIDTRREAEKLLVERVNGSLVTIAKEVSIHVDFNPAKVASYRLIGYENPLLRREDFKADAPGTGEIGAGHTVTALYEVVLVGSETPKGDGPVGTSRYQRPAGVSTRPIPVGRVTPFGDELLKVSVDYKRPEAVLSRTLTFPLTDAGLKFASATPDFKFAAAVAQFGMILRDSPHKGTGTMSEVLAWAGAGIGPRAGDDPGGHRREFVDLVRKAQSLTQ